MPSAGLKLMFKPREGSGQYLKSCKLVDQVGRQRVYYYITTHDHEIAFVRDFGWSEFAIARLGTSGTHSFSYPAAGFDPINCNFGGRHSDPYVLRSY